MQASEGQATSIDHEMTPYQAYQIDSLAQMGVNTWLASGSVSLGTIYRPAQPWDIQTDVKPAYAQQQPNSFPSGFKNAAPEKPPMPPISAEKVAPISSSVLNLKNELSSGPELIVEDLQPIEEKSVQVEVPKEVIVGLPRRAAMVGYVLAPGLIIITDVPLAFSEQQALDKLALNLGKALLKREVSEWRSLSFVWPDKLKNPYFFVRQDWMMGAFESFVRALFESKTLSGRIISAGAHAQKMIEATSLNNSAVRIAEVESLPQMLKIPELRKDAWQVIQSSFKSGN